MKDKTNDNNNNITMNEDMKEYIESLLKQQQENNVETQEHQKVAPIVSEISFNAISDITDEQLEKLNEVCNGGGNSYEYYLHIKNVCENFVELAITDEELSLKPRIYKRYDYQSVNTFNALALYMHHIKEEFSSTEVFVNASYYVEENYDNKTKKTSLDFHSSHYQIETLGLANYMYKKRYKDILIESQKYTKSKNELYYFDEEKKSWSIIPKSIIEKRIKREVNQLLTWLGIQRIDISRIKSAVVDEIFELVKTELDKKDDMLEQYTKNHPYLVQFNDIVYNIETHQVALSHRNFKLKQVHNYDIPLGNLNKKDMKYDGKTFYDLSLSIEDVRKQCQLMIERFLILFEEDQLNFIFSVLGACFYHDVARFQVALALRGGGGGGKSFLFQLLLGAIMYSGHTSSVGQEELAKKNQFTNSKFVHKEVNFIGEMSGTNMPHDMIHVLKSIQSGDLLDIEFKGIDSYSSNVYCRTIMLANENQLPVIRTTDASDTGLRRRLVVIDCKEKNEDISWKKRMKLEDLTKEIPYFALYCAMTFKENIDNDKIELFHSLDGASKKVIEGFTTKSIVNTTKEYFNLHDRYRLFFNELPYFFIERMNAQKDFDGKAEYNEYTEENFKEWLTYLKCTEVEDLFKKWHEEKYTTRKGSNDIETYLKENNIKKEVKHSPKLKKAVRCYFENFAKLVIEYCLEDNADSYFQALSDNKF